MNRKIVISAIFLIFIFSFGCQNKNIKGFAEINNTSIFYSISGKGIPIILVHGFTFDSQCWKYQIPILEKQYQVISYDLRGFGKSSLPDTAQAYSHTLDLLSLMDYLGIDQAVLLGHSYGGRVVIDFSLKYPERVIGLILPEAAMDANDMEYGSEFDELIKWLSDTRNAFESEGLEKAKEVWMSGPPLLPSIRNAKSRSLVEKMINEYSGWHWINRNSNPLVGFENYSVKDFQKIEVPTLILYGSISPIGYLKLAEIQNENFPNSKLVEISNAAHALNIENPDQFNKELLDFLKDIK